jgi:tRNA threonylcarbamoyladenosine biosynthesis protein TsaB
LVEYHFDFLAFFSSLGRAGVQKTVLVLAIDTATKHTAVALVDAKRVLAQRCQPATTHSTSLIPMLDKILQQASVSLDYVGGLAVGIGPGSFTGVRIGLTAAKSLALAKKIPLVGVSSLQALACNGSGLADEVCPAIDALKKEIYCARYRLTKGRWETLEPEGARDPQAWATGLLTGSGTRAVMGSGLLQYKEIIEAVVKDRLVPLDGEEVHHVSAAHVALLAMDRLLTGDVDDPACLEPLYCRLSEAEVLRQKREKTS